MAFEDGFGFEDDFFYDTGSGFSTPQIDFSSIDIGFGPGKFSPEYTPADVSGMDMDQFSRFFDPGFDFDLDIGFGPGSFTPDYTPADVAGMDADQFNRFSEQISSDAEAQEGGFYGNTPNAQYDPKTNTTTFYDNDGNPTRTIQGPATTTNTTTTNTKVVDNIIKQFIDSKTGGGQNTALLAALLGGLVGLLTKGGKPRPVGYQGGIPKYTATRGAPGQGVTYTKAAGGGLMDLAEGGRAARYLRGGTDGMADKIQTSIDGKQPARLSHGEFVIPADVVSHLGNGNSDAGADVLYDMMAKVRKARTGTPRQGKQINPRKYTPV